MTLLELFARKRYPLADAERFAQFYESTHLSTYRYVMGLSGGNESQAEDITADAYLRAWENRSSFQGSSEAALGWVITIARHLLIDRFRAQSMHPFEVELDEGLLDDVTDVEKSVLTQELTEQVIAALQQIPEQPREMVVLRYMLGWRVNQIAEHLGMLENTAAVAIRRALKRLRDILVAQGGTHGRQA